MKTLLLVGGTMGVGKTATCQALKKQLPNAVFLDGDWCWDADPFQVTEETKSMVLDNICHVLSNFLTCSAYGHVIFCWVMHEQAILNDILARLPLENCNMLAVSLVCDEETLKARLEKDIRNGVRSSDVIVRSLARLPLYTKLNTVKLDTTGKTVAEVTEALCGMLL